MADLLSAKGWLREVVVESMLEFAEHVTNDILLEVMIPKFEELLVASHGEMTSSQLMLAIGEQLHPTCSYTCIYTHMHVEKKAALLESHPHDIQPFWVMCYRLADIPYYLAKPFRHARCTISYSQ